MTYHVATCCVSLAWPIIIDRNRLTQLAHPPNLHMIVLYLRPAALSGELLCGGGGALGHHHQ